MENNQRQETESLQPSMKERCWSMVSNIMEKLGPGCTDQIEFFELAEAYGEKPDDAIWVEFARALEAQEGEQAEAYRPR
jgi:hypothetical protein